MEKKEIPVRKSTGHTVHRATKTGRFTSASHNHNITPQPEVEKETVEANKDPLSHYAPKTDFGRRLMERRAAMAAKGFKFKSDEEIQKQIDEGRRSHYQDFHSVN